MTVTYNIYQNGTKIATSTTTSYTLSGLTPSTTYSYQVSAVVNGKEGPLSAALPITTRAEITAIKLTLPTWVDQTQPVQLTYTITPSTEQDTANVVWTSSNTSVATVSDTGLVTPISNGNVTITATVQGTTITDSISMTISAFVGVPRNLAANNVTKNSANLTWDFDEPKPDIQSITDITYPSNWDHVVPVQLDYISTPDGSHDMSKVVWKVNNPDYASISDTGYLTPLINSNTGNQLVTVTVSVPNTSITYSKEIALSLD